MAAHDSSPSVLDLWPIEADPTNHAEAPRVHMWSRVTFERQGWSPSAHCACWKLFMWNKDGSNSYWISIGTSIESNLIPNCEPQPRTFHIGLLSADCAVSDDVAPLCHGASATPSDVRGRRSCWGVLLIGRASCQTAGYLRIAGCGTSATPARQFFCMSDDETSQEWWMKYAPECEILISVNNLEGILLYMPN